MDIDQDKLNLLETQLVERVEQKVRSRLFRYYISTGVLIAAALGYFGYDTVSSLKSTATDVAKTAVAGAEKEARDAAKDAANSATRAQAKLEALDAHITRREAAMLSSENATETNRARVAAMREDVTKVLEDIQSSLKAMNDQTVQAKTELAETNAQIQALRDRSNDLAGSGNLSILADGLEKLTNQVVILGAQVESLQQLLPGDDAPPTLDNTAVEQVLEAARQEKNVPEYTADLQKPTVYFQFAGVSRDVAERVSAELRDFNYTIPGEERTGLAAGMREIRYFFEEDRAAAEQLKTDLAEILDQLGYVDQLEVRDLTGYSRAKPRVGTIELWLEPRSI